MARRRVPIVACVALSLVTCAYLTAASTIEAAPQVVGEDWLPEFWGGFASIGCGKCAWATRCYIPSSTCSTYSGNPALCNASNYTDNLQLGLDTVHDVYSDCEVGSWELCAVNYKCKDIAGACTIWGGSTNRYAYNYCDPLP